MSTGLSHNKKRNCALLYEFLIRHVSKCLVNRQPEAAKQALEISKKYFSVGMPLHEELELFKSIIDSRVQSRHFAQKIIETVCQRASMINARELDVAKSKLIKEINYSFKDKNFYNYKIPGYIVYASVQALLNNSRNKKQLVDEIQRLKLEDVVCDYMVNSVQPTVSPLTSNPSYNNTVYNLVVEKFNKKYDQKLNLSQKKLLMQYAAYMISGDDSKVKQTIQEESKNILNKIQFITDEKVRSDVGLMQKISECKQKFAIRDKSEITDESIMEFLRFMQLADEVES
jgi:hypothetical protein